MTDQDLLTAVQYALLEPPDGGLTFPSGLWTRAEVLGDTSERQNRLLKQAKILVGIASIPLPAGQHRVTLPQDWLITVGVAWRNQAGTIFRALERGDSFEADHGLPSWVSQTGPPLLYMDQETPTLEIQIAPAPAVSGALELLYIPEMPEITGVGDVFALPDTFALPVLKYAVLAELYGKDGRGKNPEKAAYAELRVQLGVEMAGIILEGWV